MAVVSEDVFRKLQVTIKSTVKSQKSIVDSFRSCLCLFSSRAIAMNTDYFNIPCSKPNIPKCIFKGE
jgi:hypothetical protein